MPATPLGAQKQGTVRIVACHGNGSNESSDLAELPGLLAAPDHKVWVDLASPDEDQVKAAAEALGLHPLIAEDIREILRQEQEHLIDLATALGENPPNVTGR